MKIEYINLKESKYEIPTKVFLPNNKIEKVIIACHGFGGDKESSTIKDLAEEMILKNIAVITFDFPAHGESKLDGKELAIENCIDNINTVYRYSKKFNAPISLFATSFGAYINLINIARNNNEFQEIVLRSPAIEMAKILKEVLLKESFSKYKENGHTILGFERKMKIPYSFYEELLNNNINKIYDDIEIPKIHIIQGNKDEIAIIEDTIKFVENHKKQIELNIIDKGDHRMKSPELRQKVMSYANGIYK